MRSVTPETFLISRPSLDMDEVARYLRLVGAGEWLARYMSTPPDQAPPDGETLIEIGGRQCYRSWQPGLNANVSRVREDRFEYLGNILSSGHGSVLEHSNYSFILHNVSRVFTHEIVRHRAGVAICLAGDTKVQIITSGFGERGGRTDRDKAMLQHIAIQDLWERWHLGSMDVRGRRRRLPSSRQRRVRVLNEETQIFETALIRDIVQSGVKSLDQITLVSSNVVDRRRTYEGVRPTLQLRCTGDHAIYTARGWVKAKDLQGDDLVAIPGKRNAMPSSRGFTKGLRSAISNWTALQREVLIRPVDQCYVCDREFSRDELELDHIVPVIVDLARALDLSNLAPICHDCHSAKTAQEQPDRLIVAGSKFVAIESIERDVVEEMTYDLVVDGPWNNFVANGVVVHNSQESMRFVRLTDLPMWHPEWAQDDEELMERNYALLQHMEEHQTWMAEHFGLDNEGVPFSEKKAKTSYMRRYAPDGVATGMLWTANVRALRHVISMRTDEGAEEEIRLVGDQVATVMEKEVPALFQDFERTEGGVWKPKHWKV